MSNSRMAAFVRNGTPSALPIYASPFAKSAPAGGDDDGDEDDDDDDDDDEDDDDPDADKSDEELRAELKATRESLAKANGQSAKRRKALRLKEAELTAERTKRAGKKPKSDDDDDAPDLEAIRDEARREGAAPALLRAKKAEAKSELIAAGVDRASVATAIRMLDFDELDLDDDGLDGIDGAIAELRRTLPALFAKKRTRRESVVVSGDRDGKDRRPKPKTASELAAARILGR